ncbi:unnamed protein product [Eretmochelys imbricata]
MEREDGCPGKQGPTAPQSSWKLPNGTAGDSPMPRECDTEPSLGPARFKDLTYRICLSLPYLFTLHPLLWDLGTKYNTIVQAALCSCEFQPSPIDAGGSNKAECRVIIWPLEVCPLLRARV